MNFYKSNLTNKVNFSSDSNCSLDHFQLSGSSMLLWINYEQDIQGKDALITVKFDPNLTDTLQAKRSLTFKECTKHPLLYDASSTSMKNMFRNTIVALGFVAFVIWLVGSYSHKMIGVETIHTFQLIFLTLAFSRNYEPYVSYFQGLNTTMGNLKTFFFTEVALADQNEYYHLTYSTDFIYNDIFIIALQICIMAVFFIILLLQRNFKNDLITNANLPVQITTKRQCFAGCIIRLEKIYYDFLIFPSFIGFFYNQVLALGLHSRVSLSKIYPNPPVQSTVILLTIFPTFAVFFKEWRSLFNNFIDSTSQKYRFKHNYIPIYLSYTLLLCFVFQMSLFKFILKPVYIFGSLMVSYGIFITLYTPYNHKVHNIGLIINEIGKSLALAWVIVEQFFNFSSSTEEAICYGLIGWIIIVQIWAVIRIVYQLRIRCFVILKKKPKIKQKKVQKTYDEYENEIKQAIQSQREDGINPFRLQAQKIQLIDRQNTQIHKLSHNISVQQIFLKKQKRKLRQMLNRDHYQQN